MYDQLMTELQNKDQMEFQNFIRMSTGKDDDLVQRVGLIIGYRDPLILVEEMQSLCANSALGPSMRP